jgi:hypothetical protein
MAITFSTQCRQCATIYAASRSDAVYCGSSCRSAVYRARRAAALRHDLEAFRSGVADILSRLEAADGDPDLLAVLGAEVAAFTPESLAYRQP